MTKTCSQCGDERPLEDFHRQKAGKHGRNSWCKTCMGAYARKYHAANRERQRERSRAWYQQNKERELVRQRERQYGMTEGDVAALQLAQAGRCAICFEPFTETPRVDHCHDTGKVRGLLCRHCNSGIGFLRDDPLRVAAALEYLTRS